MQVLFNYAVHGIEHLVWSEGPLRFQMYLKARALRCCPSKNK